MHTSEERKGMLLAMKDDLLRRLREAQANVAAVDRLIAAQEEIEPPVVSASGNTIRDTAFELLKVNGKADAPRPTFDEIGGKRCSRRREEALCQSCLHSQSKPGMLSVSRQGHLGT